MKTLTRIIASLSIFLTAAACQQFDIDTQMTPEKELANLRLVCDAVDSYSFPSTNANNVTFNVSSNTPWTITRSSGAEWCTVTPSSSSSSTLISDVVVSVADNESGEDRTATLTVKGERINSYYTITINQSRKGKLFVTPIAKDFVATGGPLSFTINTNMEWEVRTDVSWLSFNRENGQPDPDGRTITIIATAEPSDVLERVATVTVVAGDDEESFDVTQKGTFDLTEITGTFPGSGATQQLKLRTDLPWTVSADKDWVSFDKESGEGSSNVIVINVTAAPNDDVNRSAVITVTAGGQSHEFEIFQTGAAFEIIAPEDPTINRLGGELLIEVNTTKSWEPQTDVPGFTVEKVDDSHFKVVAGFNGSFAPRKGQVSIVSGTATASVEISQDVNFEVENAEVLADGSVKLDGANGARVYFKDGLRYFKATLKVKEISFGSSGQFWFFSNTDSDFGNWMTVGKFRLRTNNGAVSNYGNTYYDDVMSVEFLNTMTKYEFTVTPDAETPGNGKFIFTVNDTTVESHSWASPFAGNETVFEWYFGFNSAVEDGTYYVIESVEFTPIAE